MTDCALLQTVFPDHHVQSNCCTSKLQFVNILCDTDGRVTSLTFNTGYGASLPESLQALNHLTNLDLSRNAFQGAIPTEFGLLTSLQRLDLSSNNLTGTVPSELSNLSNLVFFHVENNKLSGSIPDSLQTIRYRNFENNCFRSLPFQNPTCVLSTASESNLPAVNQDCAVVSKALSDVGFSKPIPSSGSLCCSWSPMISCNSFGFVTSLTVRNSGLRGRLPEALGNLPMLTKMALNGNEISGPIPESFKFLSNLLSLDLSDNKMEGSIPPGLGQLSRLTELYLNNNLLTGSIPVELASLNQLVDIDCTYNYLGGTLPPSLKYFEKGFNHNCITGTNQPDQIDCVLPGTARILHIVQGLAGVILVILFGAWLLRRERPVQQLADKYSTKGIGESSKSDNAVRLFIKRVTRNAVNNVEPGVFDVRSLWIRYWDKLWIQRTYGALPNYIFILSQLQSVNLNHNLPESTVPSKLGDAVNLKQIDLSFNKLVGPLPESAKYFGAAGTRFFNNQLSGTIPTAFGNMTQLNEFNLEHNHFTGLIPQGLSGFGFDHNFLSGLNLANQHECLDHGGVDARVAVGVTAAVVMLIPLVWWLRRVYRSAKDA
ncbi:hypothetical protein HDU80_006083 [Chytriomyces hyalinus]|nr:hypothetical protein HDU80_006083 [Chytriomyces hyalinus]